jgi:transcription elongation factor Elf1
MFNYSVYSAILGLSSKWSISNITEDKSTGLIELHIKSNSSETFACAVCGEENSPTGVQNKRWLYNNKLNIKFHVSLYSPQIICSKCGNIHSIDPWNQTESIQLDYSI